MFNSLLIVKPELKPLFINHKVTYQRVASRFIETLTIQVKLPVEMTSLQFILSHFIDSASVSMSFGFIKKQKKSVLKKELYSLSSLKPDAIVPVLSKASLDEILSIQKYILKEQVIVAEVSFREQLDVLVNCIKVNFPALIDYGTEFAK
jgi:hypothetical protein